MTLFLIEFFTLKTDCRHSYSMTATFTLLDSCCIYLTEFHHGSIGAQKIFGTISTIIFSFVAGALVTWITLLRSKSDKSRH